MILDFTFNVSIAILQAKLTLRASFTRSLELPSMCLFSGVQT